MVSATIIPARKAPISAARPMLAEKAARPRQRITAGSSGDSAKRGASSSCGRRCSSRVPPSATKATKAIAIASARAILPASTPPSAAIPTATESRIRARMSSTTAAPSTVRAARRAGDPEVEEGRRGDPGAGRRQRGAEEDAGLGALAERQPEPDSGEEGEDDAGAADGDRDPADRPHLREPRLQADPEEQEDDAELGEDPQHLADLDQAEHRGTDQNPAEDLADDRRLADPLEDLVAELGREQDQEEVGEDPGGVAGGGEGEGGDDVHGKLQAG